MEPQLWLFFLLVFGVVLLPGDDGRLQVRASVGIERAAPATIPSAMYSDDAISP